VQKINFILVFYYIALNTSVFLRVSKNLKIIVEGRVRSQN
jgi:hypothetical protein